MKMTPYKAQEELHEARVLIERVKRATGNCVVRGSCNIILRPLNSLIDNIIKIDFDKEDRQCVLLEEE